MSRSRLNLSVLVVIVIAFGLSATPMFAQPGETGNGSIPPGLTKTTFIHHKGKAPQVVVEHGNNGGAKGSPFSSAEAKACAAGGTDQCDSYIWDGKYWPGAAVTYNVNLKNSGDDGNFVSAVQASAQTWEDETGSAFDFEYGGLTGRKASSLRNRMDGNNDVTWDDVSRYQNPIAVTIIWSYTATGVVVETDMINDKNIVWATDGNAADMDVQNIITHEFGHFLVLGDLYDASDIELTMYGLGTEGETKKRDLGVGDQLGIRAIYPSGTPNDSPVVSISSPADGVTFASSATIAFAGMASDTEDDDISADLVWTSSIDGVIGSGGSFSAVLSDGSHTITASATDSGGASGSDSIGITVGTVTEPAEVSVQSVTYSTTGGKNSDKHLRITVALLDDLGGAVAGASVSIQLNLGGSQYASGTGTTGTDGTVTFIRRGAPCGTYDTVVTTVSATGLSWVGGTPANSYTKC